MFIFGNATPKEKKGVLVVFLVCFPIFWISTENLAANQRKSYNMHRWKHFCPKISKCKTENQPPFSPVRRKIQSKSVTECAIDWPESHDTYFLLSQLWVIFALLCIFSQCVYFGVWCQSIVNFNTNTSIKSESEVQYSNKFNVLLVCFWKYVL